MSVSLLSLTIPRESGSYFDMNMLILWIAVLIIFLVIEAITTNLTTIWFAVGSVAAIVCCAVGFMPIVQFLAFAVFSALFLILAHPFVKKMRKKKNATNKDSLIGAVSCVTEAISNTEQTGYIKIGDVFWVARSDDGSDIPVGSFVTVKEIHGNKLIVVLKK